MNQYQLPDVKGDNKTLQTLTFFYQAIQ